MASSRGNDVTQTAAQLQSVWRVIIDAVGVLAMTEQADEKPGASVVRADAKLVAAAVVGDTDAFGRIVEMHQRSIAAQMRRFSRDRAVVEELVHDVFVEAYFSLKSYRGTAPFVHWLRKIAVRVGYRYWKRRSHSVQLSEDNAGQLVARLNDSETDASETLGDLLDLLPVRDRLVLTLIYWDGCTIAEAARLAGWSPAMVKVQAFRARKRLRSLIEDSLK